MVLKKTIIIHIGFPKTGTTSIQKFCRRNRASLDELGIVYPKLSVRNAKMDQSNHTALMEALIVNPPSRLAKNRPRARDHVDHVIADFRSSSRSTLLLSHEVISQRREIDFDLLRTWIGGDRLSIVVVVRTFDEWLESLYAEGVRSGLQIARPFPRSRLSRFEDFRFITKLRRFRAELPQALLHVLNFDKIRKEGLVAEVLRCTGLTQERLLKNAAEYEARNVSRPASDVLFAAYASVVLNDARAAHRVASILDEVREGSKMSPGPVCLVPFDLRSRARESYRADLPLFASEFGVEIDDPGPVDALYAGKRTFLTEDEYDQFVAVVTPAMERDETRVLRAGYQQALDAMS